LTEAERRILRYLPTNLSVPEIAAELFCSVNTVKIHIRHMYAKLGARSSQADGGRVGLCEGGTAELCRARALWQALWPPVGTAEVCFYKGTTYRSTQASPY
jgi:DNA-binding NarL/FixJ family response regulator